MDEINPVQVQKYLSGVAYPCDKQTLIDTAKENGAPPDVIDYLEQNLPDDEEFESAADVSATLS